jgi:hypothetical protein
MPDGVGDRMLTEALAALAGAAGTAVVAAMATDAWDKAKSRVLRLYRDGGSQRRADVEKQLEDDNALVSAAHDPSQVRQGLVPAWQEEIAHLLEDFPEAEAGLRTLLAQSQSLPQTGNQLIQTNAPKDHAILFAVQDGTQEIHYYEDPSKGKPLNGE